MITAFLRFEDSPLCVDAFSEIFLSIEEKTRGGQAIYGKVG
jgi:hypothetical protein